MDLFSSIENRNEGIEQAVKHADQVNKNWSEKAYQFLLEYMKTNSEFMTEEVRFAAYKTIPHPPSARAWGAVIVRASKNNLIERKEFRSVKNPRAHSATATLWKTVQN